MNNHLIGDRFERVCRDELMARWPGSKVIETKKDSVHGIDFAVKLGSGHIAIVEVKSRTGSVKNPQMTTAWIRGNMQDHLQDEIINAFRMKKKVFRATYRVVPEGKNKENNYSIRAAKPTGPLNWSDFFPGIPEPAPENFQLLAKHVSIDNHTITVVHKVSCGKIKEIHKYQIEISTISKAVYDSTLIYKSFPFKIPHSHRVLSNGRESYFRSLRSWDDHLSNKSSLDKGNVSKRRCDKCQNWFYCTSSCKYCYPCGEQLSESAKSKAVNICEQARVLSQSEDWKKSTPKMKQLQTDWKSIVGMSKMAREKYWPIFQDYSQEYFGKLKSHYEKSEKERQNNKRKAKSIISQASSVSQSNDWKNAAQKIKDLQKEWKNVHPLPRDDGDRLWKEFQSYTQHFFEQRAKFFKKQERLRNENMVKANDLIRRAEGLSRSNEWKEAGNKIKHLKVEWKRVTPLPRDAADDLWSRFNRHIQSFYDRRTQHFERQERERQKNKNRKETLISRAKDLSYSSDLRSAIQEIKQLQREWKSIGHVPRDDADRLWSDFRENCDSVFEAYGREKERRQREWRERTQGALDKARDAANRLESSINHDEDLINRWENTISNLRPGGRADEIRYSLEEKIRSVESKERSKRSKLEDIYRSIQDMENKLR